jgi:hypothetical protein
MRHAEPCKFHDRRARRNRFRAGSDPRSPERLRFEDVVGRRALRANLSGVDFYRGFTP